MTESEESAPQFGTILSKWKAKGDQQNDLLKLGGKYKASTTAASPKTSTDKSEKRTFVTKRRSSFEKDSDDDQVGGSRVAGNTDSVIESLPMEGSSDSTNTRKIGATDHGRRSSFTFWKDKNKDEIHEAPSTEYGSGSKLQDSNSKIEPDNDNSGSKLTAIADPQAIDTAVSPKPSDVRRKFNVATSSGSVPTMFASKGLGFRPTVSRVTSPKPAPKTNVAAPHTEPTMVKTKVVIPVSVQAPESPIPKTVQPVVTDDVATEHASASSDDQLPVNQSPKTLKAKITGEGGLATMSPKKTSPIVSVEKVVAKKSPVTSKPKLPAVAPELSPVRSPQQTVKAQVAPSTPQSVKPLLFEEPSSAVSPESPISPSKRVKGDAMKSFMASNKVPSLQGHRHESIRMTSRMSSQNVYQKPLDDTPDFRPPVHERIDDDEDIIRNALMKNFVFSSLPERELEEMCQAFEDCSFNAGDTIIEASQPGEHFYIVRKGAVDLITEGKPASQARDGDTFGELSLVYAFAGNLPSQQAPVSGVALANTDVTLFRVDQKTVRRTLKSQQLKSEDDRLNLLQGVRFLKDLCEADLKKLASVMTPAPFGKDQLIVERGAAGESSFYIIQEGSVICKDVTGGQTDYADQTLGPGEWFGEGSLISNETRHMNVIAQSRGMLYSIDRKTFDSVLGKFKDLVLKAQDAQRLAGMKCLQNAKLNGRQLAALASVIVEKKFMTMQLILAQALKTKIAIFFVRKGEVEISTRGKVEVVKAGGYFGDSAFKDDGTFDASLYWKPPFSAKALTPVVCGVLSLQDARTVFDTALLADQSVMSESFNMSWARIDTDADLEDLIKNSILGEGTFGQVWLVSEPLPELEESRPFALKIQSKCELAREGQIKAVMEEKNILAQIQHPFTCKLIKAFQDSMFVYLLMEYVQGGELFSLLHSDEHHDKGFPDEQAKFYAFCLADVFAYIHRSKIVFRDLKPENVMIDHLGYPILIDFGFAKYVPDKTYTLCGTPGYLPPEVVTTRGHDCSADHWSLGILIHEMVVGSNPFYYEGMDQISLFHSIVMDQVEKPKGCSDDAGDLILRLLVKDPTRRLGSLARGEREIIEHSWFQNLDLNDIRRRRVTAPWVPKLKDAFDTSCFEDWSHLEDITTQDFGEIAENEKAMFRGFEEVWD